MQEKEGTFLRREELLTNQEYVWQALFGKQKATLTLAIEMLMRYHLMAASRPSLQPVPEDSSECAVNPLLGISITLPPDQKADSN
jgi:hypothetical protein